VQRFYNGELLKEDIEYLTRAIIRAKSKNDSESIRSLGSQVRSIKRAALRAQL